MPIPLSYSYRNLLARRRTTFRTAAGCGKDNLARSQTEPQKNRSGQSITLIAE
jgi:hypothetical protein